MQSLSRTRQIKLWAFRAPCLEAGLSCLEEEEEFICIESFVYVYVRVNRTGMCEFMFADV